MVRRSQSLGLALLLLAGACARSVAQNPGAQRNLLPATASTQQPKAHAHPRKTAPEPPAPQAPPAPLTLEQSPPTAPQVAYNNAQLTIIAQNATLSQVLRSVQSLTGASVEMPSGASGERVVGQFGPGQPRDVLNALLNGSKFNYIILGVTGDPGAVQKVILTTAKPASAVNTAQNIQVQQVEEPQDEESYEPEPQPPPQAPLPPQIRHRPNMPGRMPQAFNQPQPPQPQPQPASDNSAENPQFPAAKSPDQLLQELQQMQQQQQQMQDQLNPANRPPGQ